jgi:hypothetical protein
MVISIVHDVVPVGSARRFGSGFEMAGSARLHISPDVPARLYGWCRRLLAESALGRFYNLRHTQVLHTAGTNTLQTDLMKPGSKAGQCRLGLFAGSEASISRRARLQERTTSCISCSAIGVIGQPDRI